MRLQDSGGHPDVRSNPASGGKEVRLGGHGRTVGVEANASRFPLIAVHILRRACAGLVALRQTFVRSPPSWLDRQRAAPFSQGMGHQWNVRLGMERPAFAERHVMEFPVEALRDQSGLMLDCPDHLGPFLGFVGDELAEVGGRAREARCRRGRQAAPSTWDRRGPR